MYHHTRTCGILRIVVMRDFNQVCGLVIVRFRYVVTDSNPETWAQRFSIRKHIGSIYLYTIDLLPCPVHQQLVRTNNHTRTAELTSRPCFYISTSTRVSSSTDNPEYSAYILASYWQARSPYWTASALAHCYEGPGWTCSQVIAIEKSQDGTCSTKT